MIKFLFNFASENLFHYFFVIIFFVCSSVNLLTFCKCTRHEIIVERRIKVMWNKTNYNKSDSEKPLYWNVYFSEMVPKVQWAEVRDCLIGKLQLLWWEIYAKPRLYLGYTNTSERQDSHFTIKFLRNKLLRKLVCLLGDFLIFHLDWMSGLFTRLMLRVWIDRSWTDSNQRKYGSQSPLLCRVRDYWFLEFFSAFFNGGLNSELNFRFYSSRYCVTVERCF